MTSLDPNFRDLLECFNSAGVQYLVLGGYAVNFRGQGEVDGAGHIASPEALYLLKVARYHAGAAAGAGAGGLIGGLIVGANSAALQKPDDTKSCKYFELPAEVRGHPDWPVKKQKKDVDLIVLPKPYVEGLRHPRFTNHLKLTAARLPCTIEYTLFRGKKVKAFLTEAGWAMEW